MAANNEIPVPAQTRLDEVGAEILAEQARKNLTDESVHIRLNLNPDDKPFSSSLNRDDNDRYRYKVLPPPGGDDGSSLQDKLADSIYPGLGRVESEEGNNRWRLDYGDPGRCKTKASVGVCFTMDIK